MKKRNLTKNSTREKVQRETDPIPWKYCLLTLLCGVILVGGFFLAARSHFSSIDLSIKNSDLKKQLQGLEDEKRRLVLMKEKVMSLGAIKKAAKKIGLTEMTASSFQSSEPAAEKKTVPDSSSETTSTVPKPKVENPKKTSAVVADSKGSKSDKNDKSQAVKDGETRERKVSKTGK